MNIVHISTNSSGGAFKALFRLHESLILSGINSKIFVLEGNSREKNIYVLPYLYSFIIKVYRKYWLPIYYIRYLNPYFLLFRKSENFEIFSFIKSPFRFYDHPKIREADIIHLHWINNFIDYKLFFNYTKKPIIWTLHDKNILYGGFHYENDYIRNYGKFSKVEEIIRQLKIRSISKAKNLVLIAPSDWLKESIENSQKFKGFRLEKIAYTLNGNVFKPFNRDLVREEMSFPKNSIIFLFIAENLNNKRKGIDYIVSSMKALKDNSEIIFCSIGKKISDYSSPNFIQFGYVQSEEMIAKILNLSNALLLPSIEDNLPNVMLESLFCGIPVISFSEGGMSKIICDNFNGLKAKSISNIDFLNAIKEFILIKDSFDKQKIREDAFLKFSHTNTTMKYIEIYKGLFKNHYH